MAIQALQEEPVSDDLEEVVKDLWNEINSGHEYSVIESYNVFYGLCLDIANWQKELTIKKIYDWLRYYEFLDENNHVNMPTLLCDFMKDSKTF